MCAVIDRQLGCTGAHGDAQSGSRIRAPSRSCSISHCAGTTHDGRTARPSPARPASFKLVKVSRSVRSWSPRVRRGLGRSCYRRVARRRPTLTNTTSPPSTWVSGDEAELWTGEQLKQREVAHVGDHVYVPESLMWRSTGARRQRSSSGHGPIQMSWKAWCFDRSWTSSCHRPIRLPGASVKQRPVDRGLTDPARQTPTDGTTGLPRFPAL
jgi:hypothetical protein